MIKRLHPNLQLTRTLTARFAIQGYPLLGLPKHSEEGKHIRGLVRAPKGMDICELDYNQIELRTATELSRDETMIETFKRGEDIHVNTASEIFGVPRDKTQQDPSKHRLPAKSGNFGFWMGLGEKGLTEAVHRFGNLEWSKNCQGCKNWKSPHDETCDSLRFFRKYRTLYPGAVAFQNNRRAHAAKTGEAYGMWGAVWSLPGVFSPHDEIREATLRQSFALPIQEGAQRLIKQAMAAVSARDLVWARSQKAVVEPLLQIHDSLLFLTEKTFTDEWCARVKQTMESVTTWVIPIVADASKGPSWLELKALRLTSATTSPRKGRHAGNGTGRATRRAHAIGGTITQPKGRPRDISTPVALR